MSDLQALEHSTLKVPYEILNKKFRLAQKAIDREADQVRKVGIAGLERVLGGEKVLARDALEALESLEARLGQLAERTAAGVTEEKEAAACLQRRLDHLSVERTELGEAVWGRKRLDRLLVEYLLRAGYYQTASALAEARGLDYLANLSVFLTAKEVEESLAQGDLNKALHWCHDNRSKLRRLGSRLELHLRQQELVELLRSGRRSEAVAYAQAQFKDAGEEVWREELGALLALFAFPAATSATASPTLPPRYAHLYSPQRWPQLRSEFLAENFRLYQLAHESVFSACLESGLSALKTRECCPGGNGRATGAGKAGDCPLCSEEVFPLSEGLPFAHASHSRLVCFVSGEPLDEHNPAIMLPNGCVYGRKALQRIAEENGGKIICPRTKQEFRSNQTQRLYIM